MEITRKLKGRRVQGSEYMVAPDNTLIQPDVRQAVVDALDNFGGVEYKTSIGDYGHRLVILVETK